MVGAAERLEFIFDYGGLKKDIAVLAVSAASLILRWGSKKRTVKSDECSSLETLCPASLTE
jgi:hypothetical protein